MPQLPFSYLSGLASCSALSNPPHESAELQYALSVCFALPMLTIIPLPSGRFAVLSGHGTKVPEFSCSAAELGPALARVLHVRVDKSPAVMYDRRIEAIPDLDITL